MNRLQDYRRYRYSMSFLLSLTFIGNLEHTAAADSQKTEETLIRNGAVVRRDDDEQRGDLGICRDWFNIRRPVVGVNRLINYLIV